MKTLSNLTLAGFSAAVACGLIALAGWASKRVTVGKGDSPAPSTRSPMLVVTGENASWEKSILAESAVLFGPASLFLPTDWTASEVRLPPGVRREPGAAFPPIKAKLFQEETTFKSPLTEPFPVPVGPLAVLTGSKSGAPFSTLGNLELLGTKLLVRTIYVEAVAARSGGVVLGMPLTISSAPTEINSDWKPLEMLVAVEANGQVGLPAIVQGTGSDLLDRFFLGFFTRQLPISLSLKPGFYTLRVGP